jgi:hypothetical protein
MAMTSYVLVSSISHVECGTGSPIFISNGSIFSFRLLTDPSCRNAGVKFRYCSFCKAPVAKRNFRRRHNHGSSQPEDCDESTNYSTTSAVAGVSRRSTAHKHKTSADAVEGREAKRARMNVCPSVQSEDSMLEDNTARMTVCHSVQSEDSVLEDNTARMNVSFSVQSEDCMLEDSTARMNVSPSALSDNSMLEDNTTKVGTAMAEAAATTTYLCKETKPNSAEKESAASQKRIKGGKNISQDCRLEWANLLEERPHATDGKSMSSWIHKVLAISAFERAKAAAAAECTN